MRDVETTRVIGRKPPVARWLNAALGSWLFASSWLLPMGDAARANVMIVGICITSVALIAIFMPAVRWINSVLGIWLMISSGVFQDAAQIAIANNVIVAIAVIILSIPRDYAQRDEVDRDYVSRWARHRAR